jgi:hypothetical protein
VGIEPLLMPEPVGVGSKLARLSAHPGTRAPNLRGEETIGLFILYLAYFWRKYPQADCMMDLIPLIWDGCCCQILHIGGISSENTPFFYSGVLWIIVLSFCRLGCGPLRARPNKGTEGINPGVAV